MPIWPFVTKKPKRKPPTRTGNPVGHPTKAQMEAKRARELAAMQDKLRYESTRAKLEELRDRRKDERERRKLEREAARNPDGSIDVNSLTVAQAKALGLKLVHKDGASVEQDGLAGFLKGFLSEDGGKAAQALLSNIIPPKSTPQNVTPRSPQLPAPAVPSAQPVAQEQPPVIDQQVEMIRKALGDKSADDAATMIIQFAPLPMVNAQWLVDLLGRCTDDQVFPTLNAIAAENPQSAGLVAWLQSRGQWTIDVARAIRHQTGREAESSEAPAEGKSHLHVVPPPVEGDKAIGY